MPKKGTFSIRITERQSQGLLEKTRSQDGSPGDIIRRAIDEYLEPTDSNTLRRKHIELYDRLTKGKDTVVEKPEKIAELLSAIGNLPSSKRASR